MQRVQYKMYVDDFGWIDCWHVGQMIPSEEPEEEPEIPLNKFGSMDFSYEASVELQESFDAINAVWSVFAEAFVNIALETLRPIYDYLADIFENYYVGKSERHFDGVYNRPKMREYFKMQPNICNLNNKIRKARNLP